VCDDYMLMGQWSEMLSCPGGLSDSWVFEDQSVAVVFVTNTKRRLSAFSSCCFTWCHVSLAAGPNAKQ